MFLYKVYPCKLSDSDHFITHNYNPSFKTHFQICSAGRLVRNIQLVQFYAVFYYHEVLNVQGKGLGSSITVIIKIPPILAFLYHLVVKTTAGFKLMAQRSLPVKRMMLLLPSACSQGLVEFLSIRSCLYLKAQSVLRLWFVLALGDILSGGCGSSPMVL